MSSSSRFKSFNSFNETNRINNNSNDSYASVTSKQTGGRSPAYMPNEVFQKNPVRRASTPDIARAQAQQGIHQNLVEEGLSKVQGGTLLGPWSNPKMLEFLSMTANMLKTEQVTQRKRV